MLNFLSNNKFTHKFQTVELTKILERVPCDSISFTHRIARNSLAHQVVATPEITGHAGLDPYYKIVSNLSIQIPFSIGQQMIFGSIQDSFNINIKTTDGAPEAAVYLSDEHSYISLSNNSTKIKVQGLTESLTYTATTIDSFELKYHIEYSAVLYTPGTSDDYEVDFIYNINSAANIPAKPIPSITDVLNRILSVGVSRAANEPQKYTLDPVIAAKFKNMPAPEFFLPRMTLFEALLTVGGYIHGIPRLDWNETTDEPDTITFDLLGLDDHWDFTAHRANHTALVIGYQDSYSGDDYCGAFDSYVDNMVNTQDPTQGSIVEPSANGWKTVRCSGGVQITNETAVITTDKPIYRIVKVEMGYTAGSQTTVIGDITNFVYEKSEYDGLYTGDNATYPNSVAYALVWTQGGNTISGLNTASVSLWNFVNGFKKPAIANIANLVKSGAMSTDDVFGNLAFRVTYIPLEKVRVRQYKPYVTGNEDIILYNQQSANTVEANYYGENLKGKIARMGNKSEVYTMQFSDETQIPEVGNVFGETIDGNWSPCGYVYKVSRQRGQTAALATVCVTPDFNKLSEFVGLNSNFRLYEVSERQSIDRQIINPVPVYIGNEVAKKTDYIQPNGRSLFSDTLTQTAVSQSRFTVAVMKFRAEDGTLIGQPVTKAVSHKAFGNGLLFNFGLADNYAAGDQSNYVPGVEWKQRKIAPYGSVYGGFWALEYCLNSSLYETKDGSAAELEYTYADQQSSATSQGLCDKLPYITEDIYTQTMGRAPFSTGVYKDDTDANATGTWTLQRVVDKNSSEVISVNTYIYGQANRKSIVLGNRLWRNNVLVTEPDATKKAKIFFFKDKRLSMLRNTVDLTNAVAATVDISDYVLPLRLSAIPSPSATETFTAWAAVEVTQTDTNGNPTEGELYIGENMNIAPNETTNPIYFTFN